MGTDNTPTVAVLGTGIMGAGMARSIARTGLPLRVWNRTRDKAAPLAEHGATVADSPAEAVAGADVVVTMLFDAVSVADTMRPVLGAMPSDTVWAQMSTVGLEGTAQLADLAAEHGVGFVDAPVLGTRQPAEQGTLVVLASGPDALRVRVEPVFDAVGSRTLWVDEQAGSASRLKLVLNAWVLSITAGTAQSVALAQDLGLNPRLFLEAIAGGGTDSPYAQLKGAAMIEGRFEPAFALEGAVKDSALIAAAMREAGTDASVMTALHERFQYAAELGHTGADMAAVYHAFRSVQP
ncbi:3-hydroxyisobutyrate dehydrogenase [Longimycelium tulufanense]|uniref:3-hydroxyisobutyrate dehydrogenase n=1 Tax=Longimycelium tulufanense TaxID=907463 RepID=A0A8J3CGN0_9PSEU|nr:NAD(P)-dependent oxidoreductase [Longimycelium tulufanense]GGM58053.1 3-hydroxyisobutyrate dehydrogenase [Longimycelium tulufanense]